MKYTDRKKTPLRWHHILVFVLLPLIILGNICAVISLTDELMGLNLGFGFQFLTHLLQTAGVSIFNLGIWFWPVTAGYLLEIIITIGLIAIWIGLLRWKNSARRWWLIILFLVSAVSGLTGWLFCRTMLSSGTQTVTIRSTFRGTTRSVQLSSNAAMALVISVFVVIFLFFLLNTVYYFRRRKLFAAYYIVKRENNTVPVEEKPDKKTEENQENSITDAADTESLTEPVKEAAVENTEEKVQTDPEPEPEETVSAEAAPDTETVDSSENQKEDKDEILYCPNCGAKLSSSDVNYCTHCGTKIR